MAKPSGARHRARHLTLTYLHAVAIQVVNANNVIEG